MLPNTMKQIYGVILPTSGGSEFTVPASSQFLSVVNLDNTLVLTIMHENTDEYKVTRGFFSARDAEPIDDKHVPGGLSKNRLIGAAVVDGTVVHVFETS
jgi:hypothetical protein